ncbi:MAG: hypothetical protein HW399_293 [Dehalococcoidia bacterium]|nr:hypothetical protein [Dehalococcoidia bacterium]
MAIKSNLKAVRGISNITTAIKARVDSRTNLTKAEIDDKVDLARANMPYDHLYSWNANINGVIIRLITNNYHLADFWIDNWFPTPLEGVEPHGCIFAVTGIPDQPPFAYYCSETKTAVMLNSDYYGQVKSWALGIVADIMEMQHNIHSLHAAVVDIGGCGITLIAPTGTGKSTHSYGLTLNVPSARLHSDDWCYVDYVGGTTQGRAIARISERKFYIRTDLAGGFPRLAELFDRSKLENVGESYTDVPNSRAILDPIWVGGPEHFVHTTRIQGVVLLRRDKVSPPEVQLEAEDAINILKKGEFTILPGSGPEADWGKIKTEPFYNPYLLVRNESRTQLQVDFFRRLFQYARCYILNTGVETVEESRTRILRIAREVCSCALTC